MKKSLIFILLIIFLYFIYNCFITKSVEPMIGGLNRNMI